jgi:hypothetical protein
VPANAEALVLLTVEELALNDLREPIHHWVETLRLPVRAGSLDAALDAVPPGNETAAGSLADAALVHRAADLWLEVAPELPAVLLAKAAALTRRITERLGEAASVAIAREQERFRHRLREVERAMRETTLQRLDRERAALLADMRQGGLFPELIRDTEERLRNLEDELHRRRHHYQELLDQLQTEQARLLSHYLPRRYALRGEVQVFPLTVEIRFPEPP